MSLLEAVHLSEWRSLMTEPDANYIMKIASGFGVSKALLSAVGLGLYTRLADGL